jgi:hypothetical protein
MSSVYDVAIRIAAETKDFVKEIKSNTGMLQTMGAVAAGVFAADLVKDAAGELYVYATGVDNIREKLEQMGGLQGDVLDRATGSVKATAEVWNKDYNEVIKTSNVLVKQMGEDSDKSLRLIQQGLANGADANGDFLQQVSEYAPMFADAELSAEALIAVITQGVTSGIFSDKGPDAIKEFMLRVREMTNATKDGLEGIGISSDEVQRKLQNGTWSYLDVLKLVSTKLGEFPPQSKEVGTAIADIFGGPGEDAGLAYLKTLKDIELDMDKVTATSGKMAKQQLEQAAASEKLNTEMARLFGGSNEEIRDIKLTATQMAAGVVGNIDQITTAVKVGGTGILAYKTFVIATDFSMMKWKRTLVVTKRAIIGVNTAIKSTPIGVVIGLLSAAGVAYLAYRSNVEDTTESQEGFNSKLNETTSLLDKVLNKIEDANVSSLADFLDLDKLDTKKLASFRNEIEGLSKADLTNMLTQLKGKIGQVNREIADLEQDFNKVGNDDIFEPHTRALKTFQTMIGLVEKELGTFTNEQVGWYASIDKEIKQVKKDIDGVKEGDTERLTILQAQLTNLENQKKELKKLGEIPKQIQMPKLEFETDDNIDFDEGDLEIVDDKSIEILKNYNKELQYSARYNALLGDGHTHLKEEIELTKQAIGSLIADGYDKNSEHIKTLMGDLSKLQQEYKNSSAGYMEWVGKMQQGVGTVQQGISNITSLGYAYDSLAEKQKNGEVTALDYVGVMLQTASSLLGTIQVIHSISQALQAKQAVDSAATAATVGNEATKAAAVVSSQSTQAAAVTASASTQAIALTMLGNAGLKANAARGISAAVASAAVLPFPMNIGAMELAYGLSSGLFLSAQGLAQSLAIPMLADGGVASGPTLALVGEYPGAKGNPELIAPANKMMGYIEQAVGNAGGAGGNFTFKFENGALVAYLNNQNRKVGGFV